jgi:hypothetical protein
MDVREIEIGSIECINLAEDRDKRQAVANTVINFGVP